MAVDLGSAYGRILLDTGGAQKSIGGLSAKLGAFGKGPALLAGAALLGIGAALGSTVTAAAQFDKAMSAVQAVSGASADEMARLRDSAMALGASTTFTAREVAGAQGELVKAGVSVTDVLGGALVGSLSLAAAGELDLGQAATIAANAMNLFGLRGKDVTGIADALASAANSTTADVADFGMALSQGGSAAKAAGLSFKETVTILEAMAAIGIKNSDAGTSLKAALVQLLSPTDKAAKAAKEHGLSLLTAQGSFVGAEEASRRLRKATQGMTDAQKVAFLSTIAGVDGFRALLSLIDTGPARLGRYRKELDKQGSAARTAAIRQDNLAGDVEKLGGAFDTLKLRVGGALQTNLRGVTQAVTDVITAVGDPGALAGLADRLHLGDDVSNAWSAFTGVVSALKPVALGAGAVLLGLADAAAGVGRQVAGAVALVGPLVHALANLGMVAGAGVGGLLSLTGSIVGSTAGTVIMTTAVVALTGAFVGAKLAAIALGAVVKLAALAETAIVFVQLAASVRTATAALALFRAAAVGSAAIGLLASPVGLVAAGVAVLGGGIALLSSGFFTTKSTATDLAGALKAVDSAAKDAAGSVDAMRASVDRLTDAHSRTRNAALAVEGAEIALVAATRTSGAGSLEARSAAQRLADARVELTRATRAENAAATKATEATAGRVAALVNLALAQGTATERAQLLATITGKLAGLMGKDGAGSVAKMAHELDALNTKGATTRERLAAVQRLAGEAARAIKGTSPAAREARAALERLATAPPADLRAFVTSIEVGVANGKTKAQATSDAINRLLGKTGDVKANLAPLAASITQGGAPVIAAAARVAAGARRELAKIDPRAHGSPSVVELTAAGFAALGRTVSAGAAAVQQASERGAQAWRRQWIGSTAELGTARAAIEHELAAIDRAESTYERRREANRGVALAQAKLARASTADERKGAQEELRQAIATRRELGRVLREEAADRERIARARARPEARAVALEGISGVREGAASAATDLGEKVTGALERSFTTQVEGIDTALQATLGAIDTGLERATDAVTRGVSVSLAGVKGLAPAVRADFESITSGLAAGLGAISATITAALAPVQATLDAASAVVLGIDAELERRSRARTDRQQQAALAEATTTKAGVDAEVEKLRAIQAGARTDSERAAAGRLLTDALGRQAIAAQGVTDATEDIDTTGLERARTAWVDVGTAAQATKDALLATADTMRTELVTAAQTAVQGIADAARTTASAAADAARTALDERLADVRTTLERLLGNLGEALSTNNQKAARKAIAGIHEVLDAPDVQAALTESGDALGLAFSKGLERSTKTVEGAARDLAAAVRRYLHLESPAEAGPLAVDFRRSGLTIGADLAAGLRASQAAVRAEASRLAGAASAGLVRSTSPAELAGAGGGVTQTNIFHVERPVEDLRTWSERAMFEARLAGGRV